MTPISLQPPEKTYPSVGLAYEFAVAAYELAQKRLDVVENRLQVLLGFVPTATLAVIATAANKGLRFHSSWFFAAIVLCFLGLSFGTYVRLAGRLIVVGPRTLYEKWLHFSEWQFKKNFIFLSAKHFESNCALINRKGRRTYYTAIIFLLEAISLVLWLGRQGP